MKFTVTINFYKLNDDNTITFYVLDGEIRKYFRANGRLPILNFFSGLKVDDQVDVSMGVYYDRGRGLQLQIIEVII